MKEACGVFGVYAPDRDVAHATYDGIFALQHRGQESAGMAVADGDTITVVKDTGLVASVFDDRTLFGLTGSHAIGHTRYSTAGSMDWTSAQPVYRPVGSRCPPSAPTAAPVARNTGAEGIPPFFGPGSVRILLRF